MLKVIEDVDISVRTARVKNMAELGWVISTHWPLIKEYIDTVEDMMCETEDSPAWDQCYFKWQELRKKLNGE